MQTKGFAYNLPGSVAGAGLACISAVKPSLLDAVHGGGFGGSCGGAVNPYILNQDISKWHFSAHGGV